jgi:sulfide dehydrogenase cytochrome subunit
MILKKSIFAISSALVTCGSIYAVDVSRGAMLSNSCFACHGTDGKSKGSIPAIHGKSALQIKNSLKGFQTGPSTIMGRHSKGFSDADIEEIAKYISGLK